MNSMDSLIRRDQKIIWHPYSQHGLEAEFLPVKSGKEAWIELMDGRKMLDANSSWWVNLHGHGQPEIIEAIHQQALQLEHTLFAGFTHQPAIELAESLIHAMQARDTQLSRCFYGENRSTAVEAALKMALQYYKNQAIPERNKFIAITHAYHGETFGCMSVSMRDGLHKRFAELLMSVDFIDIDDISRLKKLLTTEKNSYAALIIEPMVQGVYGMKMHSAERLREIAQLCQEANILLICDEVFTGFHRTGPCFAFEHAGIKPDIVCLAKGLTGGFLPLAVTLTTEEIFNAFFSTETQNTFLHGHSFTANPLACAAAEASWRILQRPETQQSILKICDITKSWVTHLSQHENCATARFLGTIGVVEKRDLPDYHVGIGRKIREFAIHHGVLLRPLGASLYVLPPYCIRESELDHIYQVIQLILEEDFK